MEFHTLTKISKLNPELKDQLKREDWCYFCRKLGRITQICTIFLWSQKTKKRESSASNSSSQFLFWPTTGESVTRNLWIYWRHGPSRNSNRTDYLDKLSGTKPFSRALYRIFTSETNEVETAVHELLTQGYTRPNTQSLVWAPAGQNSPTWYSQDCICNLIWSFWIPHRSLWSHWCSLDIPDADELTPGILTLRFCLPRCQVLKILKNNKLHARLAKCKFCHKFFEFLGYIVSYDVGWPSLDKLVAVMSWLNPNNVKTLQSFFGFGNFYRRFIPGLARTALSSLAKNAAFDWKSDSQNAFDQLRHCLFRQPVLKHHDPSQPTRIESESSGYTVAAVLNQESTYGWHTVAYLSKTMTSAERNYSIQEKGLLALVYALKKLRDYLFGIQITVYTDHSSIDTWETNRELSGRKLVGSSSSVSLLSKFSIKSVSSTLWPTPVPDDKTTERSTLFLPYRIRRCYDKDDFFRDIAAYFCDADGKIPLD